MFSNELLDQAEKLVEALRQRKLMVATAESCTGGLLAGLLTTVPGTSDIFERGFVTYTNEAKMQMIDVPEEILNNQGAVSRECAEAMARGALANSAADLAVSITGIAVPTGATPAKPVGLVHLDSQERMVLQHRQERSGDRPPSAWRALKWPSNCCKGLN